MADSIRERVAKLSPQRAALFERLLREHERRGTEGMELVAYVVPGEGFDARELRRALAERLPRYMLPASFVSVLDLPRMQSGKLDRSRLPSRLERDEALPELAPAHMLEAQLLGVLREALGRDDVGVEDDFFAAGGHSLQVSRVLTQIERRLGVKLAFAEFLANPTARAMATAARELRFEHEDEPFERESIQAVEEARAPLSEGQDALWFMQQLGAGPAYNMPMRLVLRGALDVPRMAEAVARLVERHAMLRTIVVLGADGSRSLCVGEGGGAPLELIDGTGDDVSSARADEALEHVAAAPFVLDKERPFRAVLVRRGPHEHELGITLHHIAADGWSLHILLSELAALYREPSSSLPALTRSYCDFARTERAARSSDATALAFWTESLRGAPELIALQTDYPRGSSRRFAGGRVPVRFDHHQLAGLRRLAAGCGATLFMSALALYSVVLAHNTGQVDVVVGAPAANRRRRGFGGVVGLFANPIPLRISLAGAPSFRELIGRVRDVCFAAYSNEHIPFSRIVEAVGGQRDLATNPIYQVLLSFDEGAAVDWALPGIDVEVQNVDVHASKLDLELVLEERRGELAGYLEFDAHLFRRSSAERLARQLCTALAAVVADAERPVTRLSLLDASDRETLDRWNATATDAARQEPYITLFERRATETPDRVAVQDGNRTLTFSELNGAAEVLAEQLRKRGVGLEDIVAVLHERDATLLVAMLAIFKAGAAYLPLDPRHPSARQVEILRGSRCRLALAASRYLEPLQLALEGLAADERPALAVLTHPDPAACVPSALLRRAWPANAMAYVLYTSGSTGRPKGAVVEQRGLVNQLLAKARDLDLGPADRVAQTASQCFDISIWQFLAALLVGARVVIYPDEVAADPRQLVDGSSRDGVTVLQVVPSFFRHLLDEVCASRSSVPWRRLVSAGEALPIELVRRWFSRFPNIPVLNAYGPTECTIDVTHQLLMQAPEPSDVSVPIGRPIPNVQMYVLDSEGQSAPLGARGEIYAAGIGLGRGYRGDPRKTAEVFVPNPFSAEPGARLYRTGDLGRFLADGALEFLGRSDHQIKLRGFRIELGEIEAALLRIESIQGAVVVLREDGQHKVLVAYVATGSAEIGEDEIRRALRSELPEYMVPAQIVRLAALPLTPNGKIDRKALPVPQPEASGGDELIPSTDAEVRLLPVWREVLRRQKVGLHDNFFSSGGDSLLALQLVSLARRAGLELRVQQVFQHPTLSELAAVAQPVPLNTEWRVATGPCPLSAMQRGLLDAGLAAPHHWNQSVLLELDPRVGFGHVREALAALLDHHDQLRARFTERAGEGWSQEIAGPGLAPALLRVSPGELWPSPFCGDGGGVPLPAAVDRLQASLDLEHGPLFRALYVEQAAAPAQLVLVAHHLVVDAVSWRILIEDLGFALEQQLAGAPIAFPARTASFKDFVTAQSQADGGAARGGAALSGLATEASRVEIDSLVGLATARRGPNLEGSAREEEFVLPAAESKELVERALPALRASVEQALLLAIAEALAGNAEPVVSVEHHGRDGLDPSWDVSRTVGWFTRLDSVRLPACASAAPLEALRKIKEQMRSASRAPDVAGTPTALARAAIIVNYTGALTTLERRAGAVQLRAVGVGRERAAENARLHVLEIGAALVQGRLQGSITYSENLHDGAQIRELCRRIVGALESLVGRARLEPSGAWTAADFPLASLSAHDLEAIGRCAGDVEDIYELAPMQKAFWAFSRSVDPAIGVDQTRFSLKGRLDADSFELAWQAVVRRHQSLRAAFVELDLPEPLQVIHRDPTLEWHREDLRTLSDEARSCRLEQHRAADQARGFDLGRAPLVRLALFQVADREWEVLWTHHHIVLDGWSLRLVLREVAALYAAMTSRARVPLPCAPQYRDYIAFRRRRSDASDRTYWTRYMAGFVRPTALTLDRLPRAGGRKGREDELCVIDAIEARQLESFARQHGLTLGTLIHAALAIYLGCSSGESDVVFGTTVSGRPAELDAASSIVGLFINVVPTRVTIDATRPTSAWLRELQVALTEQQAHHQSPLARIAEWSEIPANMELFEVLLVIENFFAHAPDGAATEGPSAIRVHDVRAEVKTRYRLTLTVDPKDEIVLQFSYDARHFERHIVRHMAAALVCILRDMTRGPDIELRQLRLVPEADAMNVSVVDAGGRPLHEGMIGWEASAASGRLEATQWVARAGANGQAVRLGREQDAVERSRVRFYPREVAHVLMGCPALRDVEVVFASELPPDRQLIAYYVPNGAEDESHEHLAASELDAYARARLPEALVPSAYVSVERIVRDCDGFVDRAVMAKPERRHIVALRGYVAPVGALESALAAIWEDLVGTRVGALDDFFGLGGQSLLAIRMLSRVREELGVALPMRAVFEVRTLRDLARTCAELAARGAGESADGSAEPFDSAPLVRGPRREEYELSPYQLPEWYFWQLAPDSPMYNIFNGELLLEGEVDVGVFARAWELVVNRHGVFRTVFTYSNGRPVQRVLPARTISRDDVYIDCRHVSREDFASATLALAHEYAAKVLDFERGPMFHLKLAEFQGRRFQVLFLTNHILWDEASAINLARELKEAYRALLRGESPRLPELEVDYVDFADWVNAGVRAGLFEKHRQYWLKRFESLPEPLELPLDFPRPLQQTFAGASVDGSLPRELVARLVADFVGQRPGITLAMVLHAVLVLLLHRLSGQRDIVLGVPVVNRGDRRLEPVMGPFATALLMRTRLMPHSSFEQLLDTVRNDTIEALENYAYPSIFAIQEINPAWDASRGRLFSVMMGLQHNKTQFWRELSLEGTRSERLSELTLVGPLHSSSRSDLRVIFEESGLDINYTASYDTSLLRASTMTRMMARYVSLLEQVLAQPRGELSGYELLSNEERQAIVDRFNASGEAFPEDASIHARILEVASGAGDLPAVQCGDHVLSYSRLAAESAHLTRELRRRGVCPGAVVGVLLPPSVELVVAIVAVLRAGAAYVPLNPDQPAERTKTILARAGARLCLVEANREELGYGVELLAVDLDVVARAAGAMCEEAQADPPSFPGAAAAVFFTSGSTGTPKGIVVEHRGVLNLLRSTGSAYPLGPGGACLLTTPITFDVSMLDVFWPLVSGARVVIPLGEEAKDARALARLVDEHQISYLQCVPLQLDALVEARERGECSRLQSLQAVMCAGAPLSRALALRCHAAFPWKLANHYGPTEASVDVSRFDTSQASDAVIVPIGTPISNMRLYVLDADQTPVPYGVTGEITISGIGLARGYLDEPSRTALAFIPDPLSEQPGARMYRTGDLGRITEDGVLHFVGRVDRQVKVRGNRVELEEIEAKLHAHAIVRRAAVKHVADGRVDALVAYIDLKDDINVVRRGDETYRIVSLSQRPELRRAMAQAHEGRWPAYFQANAAYVELWPQIEERFAAYQVALVDEADQTIAVGQSVPIAWDGTLDGLPEGWDGGIRTACDPSSRGANTLLILAAAVIPSASGQAISELLLRALKMLAREHGLERIIVPVRPTAKTQHPEVSFAEWCQTRRPDGLLADPWLRVHERLGARTLQVELHSQHIVAPLRDWEAWYQRRFDGLGATDLPDTLQPVEIDAERGVGRYWDPCVWMEHSPAVDSDGRFMSDPIALIRSALAHELPDYMVPEHYRLLAALPLTTSGKVALDALPRFDAHEARKEFVAPRNELEERLAALFAEVLMVERVGVTEDFFALGGHSLRAVALLNRIADATGVRIPLRQFLLSPTVLDVGRALDELPSAPEELQPAGPEERSAAQ